MPPAKVYSLRRSLVEQIGGVIEVSSDDSVTVRISFPDTLNPDREGNAGSNPSD